MSAPTSWTLQSGGRTIRVKAWIWPGDPLGVRFFWYTESGEPVSPDQMVRRVAEDDEAILWSFFADGAEERPDDWPHEDRAEDNDVLAVRALANGLAREHLLEICRAWSEDDVDRAEEALASAMRMRAEYERRVTTAQNYLHSARLLRLAISLPTAAARSTAVAMAQTFHGDPADLAAAVAAVLGRTAEDLNDDASS